MKIKCLPEDFVVEERTSLALGEGRFAFYQLEKRGLDTLAALRIVRQRWRVDRAKISLGGLKDRHALTRQFLTIEDGPRRNLKETSLRLTYRGQVAEAYHSEHIEANHFRVVLRSLEPAMVKNLVGSLDGLAASGVPNYFDRQRFGSVGDSGEFIAKPWCLGDYERALWLALADGNPRDKPADRAEKSLLREHWNNWPKLAGRLRDEPRRRAVEFLTRNPRDFRRAIARLDPDLRSLYLAAYQSHLWNLLLAEFLRGYCRADQLHDWAFGRWTLPCFSELDDAQRRELQECRLPLPSARLHAAEGPTTDLLHKVLASEQIELRQLRVKYPRDTFFSKGERAAVVQPAHLEHEEGEDELRPSRRKVTVSFDLPRAAYATILTSLLAASTRQDG